MDAILKPDWQSIFSPSVAIPEIVLRGSLVYLTLFALLRVLKREASAVGLGDLLLTVLLADAVQNAMSAEYKSVTDGVILVATLLFWSLFLDWLSLRFPAMRRIIEPPPVLLVKNGRLMRKNMRKEMISEDELLAHLRKEGVDGVEQVKEAWIESQGGISVVKRGR